MASPRGAFCDFKRSSQKRLQNAAQVSVLMKAAASHVVRRIELVSFQVLTSGTPVDLGTARSGWTPAVGSSTVEEIKAPSDEDQARQEAAARLSDNGAKAKSIAQTYVLRQGRVYITNPVAHIVPLNEGSSSQAPKQFVQRGIREALRSLGLS